MKGTTVCLLWRKRRQLWRLFGTYYLLFETLLKILPKWLVVDGHLYFQFCLKDSSEQVDEWILCNSILSEIKFLEWDTAAAILDAIGNGQNISVDRSFKNKFIWRININFEFLFTVINFENERKLTVRNTLNNSKFQRIWIFIPILKIVLKFLLIFRKRNDYFADHLTSITINHHCLFICFFFWWTMPPIWILLPV